MERQTRSKEALADQLCPSPSKQPWKRGPSAPAVGQNQQRQPGRKGRAGWGGGSGDRLSLSRCSSPGNTLQLHLFRGACLTEHPKQFQDYISLSHLFARGVSQARKWVALLLFALLYTHTHKHTHICPEHTQRTSKNTESGACHGHTDSGSMNRDHPVAQSQVRRSRHRCSYIRSLIPTAQSTQVSSLGVHRPVST